MHETPARLLFDIVRGAFLDRRGTKSPAGWPFSLSSCESIRPLQGSKSSKPGREGFRVEKLPFPNAPEMGALSKRNPHFPCGAL